MTHLMTRASFIVLAAASLAACATPQYPVVEGQAPREPLTVPKPQYPIVQGETPAATPAAAETTGVTAAPTTGAVTTQTLPPPAAVTSQPLTPLAAAIPPQATGVTTTTRTIPVAAGKLVEAEGKSEVYEVEKGEGLYAVARRVGVNAMELARLNDLEPPYALQPGQELKGPASKAKAYVVERGDTLYAIARRFSVRAEDIAVENEIELAAPIAVGQKLVLPAGYKDKGPSTRTVTVEQPRTEPPVQEPIAKPATVASTTTTTPVAKPYTPPVTTPPVATPPVAKPYTPPVTAKPYTPPAVKPIVPSNPPATDAEAAAAGRGLFVWPVQGQVVQAYGPMGNGQRNDGINIAAPQGSAVKAAAAGEVIYAGDKVPGLGNVVLIRHTGNWVTAYAHLSRIDVDNPRTVVEGGVTKTIRDQVLQGEMIGEVGSTGGMTSPQLHFEIRYAPSAQDKARPIDPALILPK